MVRANSRSNKPPVIAVPTPAEDKVRLGRVALIAALGLVAGLVWPRLIGVHLVPPPPTDSPAGSASAAEVLTPSAQPTVEQPRPQESAPANTGKEPPPAVKPPKVSLAQVVSCRSTEGARESRCDSPALDSILQTPLQSLVACDAADGAHGVLSLGFDVDFEASKFDHLTVGKSTTLPASTARQLLRCAEKELTRVSLEGVAHTKSSYRMFYKVDFDDAGESAGDTPESGAAPVQTSAEVIAASGRVTVTWEAALVRAKPKDGEVLARVLGGTRLTVTGRQGEWYRVKYDAKGSEGWVYKSAIGL